MLNAWQSATPFDPLLGREGYVVIRVDNCAATAISKSLENTVIGRVGEPQNVLAFTDALIKAGKLFDLMIYPMRGHDIGDREATLHLYRTMLDFWKRNL